MIDTQNGTQGIDFRTVQDLNKGKGKKQLGQAEFLKLMTTQLQNQDPLKPQDSAAFLNQIAQFSTVDGISKLNDGFKQLSASLVSNQALQASSLIGHSVLAPTGVAALEPGGAIQGSAVLPAASGDVKVSVFDQAGQLVRRIDLGSQAAGNVDFKWDGRRNDGTYATPGNYFVKTDASVDGRNEAVDTLLVSKVRSVTLSNSGGLLLDLNGIGSLDFKEVRQIL